MGVLENLKDRFPHVSEEVVQAAFDEAGGHGGKAVAILKTKGVTSTKVVRAAPNEKTVESIRKAFSLWDTDGDGQISLKEFKALMASLQMLPAAATLLFNHMDKDSSGSLSFEEALEWMLEDFTSAETPKEEKEQQKAIQNGKRALEMDVFTKTTFHDHNHNGRHTYHSGANTSELP
mmetsp:Transcript_47756/g.86014  ORF Transcript_47756/g.86014 Transcript_47756/m.86014 type:complete len:177 (-) Transcript_47756:6-536(-)